ncbi:MAG TPA: glycosyltransferase family 39 protein [Candidatus Woesebacteria bacterium]|nr:glycosyltransferase family 39 protein [Candidatus Woesebacteria bacterium]
MKKYLPLAIILLLAAVLRVVALDKYPAGLNADEAAIGYNAWSLVQTGKDEHGVSWPVVFRSFDDYKLPVYFYLVLPFVKLFGLNIWSVRLPSAILGLGSVLLVFLLVRKLFTNNKYLPYLSALILSASPWHLQFSRGGWEVNVATFFILLGIWGFFKGLEKPKYYFLFVISLALSLYTYHSARIVSPLLALYLVVFYRRPLFSGFTGKKRVTILLALLVGIIITTPIAIQLLSKEGQARFSGVSLLSDTGPYWRALELRRGHPQESGMYVRVIHNQYLSYSLRFVKNYLSHFSPRFLFVAGDEIARSKVPEMGQSFLFLAPLFFLGIFWFLKMDSPEKRFVLFWFLVAPLAASMTFQSPHALRAQNMVIPLSIITAAGLSLALDFLGKLRPKLIKPIFVVLISIFGLCSLGRYLHMYYVHYPKELPFAWQYGFDQIAAYTKAHYDEYDHIVISDRYDQPYILMAFFLQYSPETLQKEMVMTPRDNFGFSTVRNMGKYEFHKINYDNVDKKMPNTLIIAADEPVNDKAVIFTIYDPVGKPMYKFLSTK